MSGGERRGGEGEEERGGEEEGGGEQFIITDSPFLLANTREGC